jgi:hypothetical protein
MASTKLALQTLYAMATTAQGAVSSLSSWFDFETDASGVYAKADTVRLAIDAAIIGTTAPASDPLVRIFGRIGSSGNWQMRQLLAIPLGTVAPVTTTINGGTSTAGSTSITTTGSATFGARSKDVFFYNTGTLDQSEIVPIVGHVTTTLTLATGLRFDQANGTAIYDLPRQAFPVLSIRDLNGIAVQVDNNRGATGSTVIARVTMRGAK